MAETINVRKEIIERVRTEITMDTDSSDYRWKNDVMVAFCNQTVYDLLRLRPHLLIDVDTGLPRSSTDTVRDVNITTVENSTAVYTIPRKYIEALMHGVAMRCYLQDSTDTTNASRASYELARFRECSGNKSQATASAS